jgi:hypothetical protein
LRRSEPNKQRFTTKELKHDHRSRLIDSHHNGCGSLVRHPLARSVLLQVSKSATIRRKKHK